MGNRYKRMVTLGMVSFTAILAWVYCILTYRTETVYIAIISLVLIASIYAFLLSLVDIREEKERQMQDYIAKTLQESMKQDNSEVVDCLNDMERLAKASYVQQRKMATYLSSQEEQLDAAAKKTAKLLIGYDRKKEGEAAQKAEQMQKELEMQAALQAQKEPDHTALVLEEFGKLAGDVQAVVAQLQQMTAQLTALREAVDAIEMPKYVEVSPVEAASTAVDADVEERMPEDELTEENTIESVVPELTISDGIENDITESAEQDITNFISEGTDTITDDSSTQIDDTQAETEAASTTEPEMVAEEATPTEEPESAFNTEDFFSQFGGSEDQTLKEEAQFKEDTTNAGMMDQSMIDALLGNLASGNKSADNTKPADVIPFPQQEQMDVSKEETHAEEVAEAVSEMEHEIEAAEAATEEEEDHTDSISVAQTPVNDNPNRTLSPEEIAALFASMQ